MMVYARQIVMINNVTLEQELNTNVTGIAHRWRYGPELIGPKRM